MKKTLTIMLAVLLMICMVPTFSAFAANEDFETIDTPEEFDAFTKAVNAGTYTPYGVVTITADLDMRNITDFQPLNNLTGFDLDFDNHTIYNLVVTTTGNPGAAVNSTDAALIAHRVNGSWIENLYMYNCKLIASNINRAAIVAGDFNNGGFNNIHVENCTAIVEHSADSTGKYVCGAIVAYNYGIIDIEVTVKNVRLESETALTFGSVIGCVYGSNAEVYVQSAKVENVTSKQNGVEKAVDNLLGIGTAEISWLVDLTLTDEEGAISVSNTATATGYSETPVNQEQLPEKPVETPVTTTTPTTTTKAPITTTAPSTTAPTTTVAGDDEKGGCSGFATGSVAFVALMTVAGCALLKKKED